MILASALRGLDIALYLHRVRSPGQGLSIEAHTLDEVISELAALKHTRTTISFDDGYQDAIEYTMQRAPRFANVQFVLNVCPEKIEKGVGFRWDIDQHPEQNPSIEGENARADLKGVSALTTVDVLKKAARLSNVRLGNHSNCHLPIAALPGTEAEREIRQSCADFTRLFGEPVRDFAFPFGVPHKHFSLQHVELLRSLGVEHIWCTRESPMPRSWQKPGAILPRIHLLGEWSVDQMMKWILRRALVYRVRHLKGSARDFPL